MRGVCVFLFVACFCAAADSGGWLDQPVQPWNKAGARLPKAPRTPQVQDFCVSEVRSPKTPEERAVAQAGWVVAESVGDKDLSVVTGASELDGMCRPDQYQDFVFVKGAFAGTVSPVLMDSREDGSSGKVAISAKKNEVQVEFLRYVPDDPRCCPSRLSEATFTVRPVVTLVKVTTKKTSPN